ncbi:hypothetical protein E2542_SST07445 [Spatholobus suberectus]|nr:hypothetical protein E2542_SST07445 [Spatholobus suberectus]
MIRINVRLARSVFHFLKQPKSSLFPRVCTSSRNHSIVCHHISHNPLLGHILKHIASILQPPSSAKNEYQAAIKCTVGHTAITLHFSINLQSFTQLPCLPHSKHHNSVSHSIRGAPISPHLLQNLIHLAEILLMAIRFNEVSVRENIRLKPVFLHVLHHFPCIVKVPRFAPPMHQNIERMRTQRNRTLKLQKNLMGMFNTISFHQSIHEHVQRCGVLLDTKLPHSTKCLHSIFMLACLGKPSHYLSHCVQCHIPFELCHFLHQLPHGIKGFALSQDVNHHVVELGRMLITRLSFCPSEKPQSRDPIVAESLQNLRDQTA